jgi:hypothetical protein
MMVMAAVLAKLIFASVMMTSKFRWRAATAVAAHRLHYRVEPLHGVTGPANRNIVRRQRCP